MANGKAIFRYANLMSGATCLTCEYTTVPRILSNSATANDSRVNRNVIAKTRAGIRIHRGPPELAFAIFLGYTIVLDRRDRGAPPFAFFERLDSTTLSSLGFCAPSRQPRLPAS